MSKAVEEMTLFEQAFAMRLDRVRNAFEMRQREFVKAAQAAPASAIRQAAAVAEAQYALGAWQYAATVIFSNRRDRGEKAALEMAIEAIREHIVLKACEGRSDSDFSNGVKQAEIVGNRVALDELKYLADHPAW